MPLFAFGLSMLHTVCIADERKPAPNIYLMQYLGAMSDKLDCYFTREWNQKDGFSYVGREIPDDATIDSIKALIEKLRRDTPDIEAVQDAENPVIVHLRTLTMKNSPDRVLDQKVSLQYKGAARNVPKEIGRRANEGIGLARVIGWPKVTPDDYQTIVEVKAENRAIRSILSDYMPLSRYSGFLWLALDAQLNQKSFMEIYYYGTNGSKPFSGNAQDKTTIYPFSDARNAYFLNPLSGKLVGEATKFITDGFASNKTVNVRWSMYYLGKQKIGGAIPLLLEHLAYRYTTVPVLAEAYPAVHALLDMGTLANAPVQKQLEAESDPLRLQLLCAVLLGVNGAKDGRRLTTETASKLSNAQEKRIMTALIAAEGQLIAVPPSVVNVLPMLPAGFVPTQAHPFPDDSIDK